MSIWARHVGTGRHGLHAPSRIAARSNQLDAAFVASDPGCAPGASRLRKMPLMVQAETERDGAAALMATLDPDSADWLRALDGTEADKKQPAFDCTRCCCESHVTRCADAAAIFRSPVRNSMMWHTRRQPTPWWPFSPRRIIPWGQSVHYLGVQVRDLRGVNEDWSSFLAQPDGGDGRRRLESPARPLSVWIRPTKHSGATSSVPSIRQWTTI